MIICSRRLNKARKKIILNNGIRFNYFVSCSSNLFTSRVSLKRLFRTVKCLQCDYLSTYFIGDPGPVASPGPSETNSTKSKFKIKSFFRNLIFSKKEKKQNEDFSDPEEDVISADDSEDGNAFDKTQLEKETEKETERAIRLEEEGDELDLDGIL